MTHSVEYLILEKRNTKKYFFTLTDTPTEKNAVLRMEKFDNLRSFKVKK